MIKKTAFIIYAFIILSCGKSGKDNQTNGNKLIIYAAASLTDVISEITDSFTIKTNIDVSINFASSGTLAKQIIKGGATDIYISANKKWADYIDSLGNFTGNSKIEIATNKLVLIAPIKSQLSGIVIDSSFNLPLLLKDNLLAIGNPNHVPAGIYAKQALSYFGWYKQVEKSTLPTKDVRSVLMMVEMNEAALGIIYRTDAIKSNKVKILNSFPDYSHSTILYTGGICTENKNAEVFFTYLLSADMKKIWNKHGFIR